MDSSTHAGLLCPLAQTHVHESEMPTNHLTLCHPLLLPSILPSIRVFFSESVLCIRWPNYWSFSISLCNEYSGLISFRMDWLDLLAVLQTLKSLLQHHSAKASVPQCSAFFMVQLSHPYMTIGKTIALTRQTFVNKVISPLLRLVCIFFGELSVQMACFLVRLGRLFLLLMELRKNVLWIHVCCHIYMNCEYFPLARCCLSLFLSMSSEEHNCFPFSFFFYFAFGCTWSSLPCGLFSGCGE